MAIRVERSISDEGEGQENRIAASSTKCKGNKAGWSFYQGHLCIFPNGLGKKRLKLYDEWQQVDRQCSHIEEVFWRRFFLL